MSRFYCVWQLPFTFRYVHGKKEYYINVTYILQTSLRVFLFRNAYNNNNDDICTERYMNNREMNNNKTNRISIILDNEMFTIICGQL